MLENAITVVLVWGSFIIAEQVGASGVIAVGAFGVVLVSLLLQGLTIPLLIRWTGVARQEGDEVTE